MAGNFRLLAWLTPKQSESNSRVRMNDNESDTVARTSVLVVYH